MANLRTRSDPVLGAESEDRQPTDVSLGRVSDHFGQILFAGGVPIGARKTSTARPSTIAVHDARDMDAGW